MAVKQSNQVAFQGSRVKVLQDCEGQTYPLFVAVQGDRHCFRLYDGRTCIGEARCSWAEDGGMLLDDIAIANEANPPSSLLERFQQLALGWELEPVSYRQRGLGTALLQSMIDYARQLGATVLRGEVFQPDVENNPELLRWYEAQGFQQSPPGPDQPDVLAEISFQLCPKGITSEGVTSEGMTSEESAQFSSSSH